MPAVYVEEYVMNDFFWNFGDQLILETEVNFWPAFGEPIDEDEHLNLPAPEDGWC